MIDISKYTIFSDNMSNLKELSKDDSDKNNIKYMTESLRVAVDFDAVKTKYTNDLNLSEESATSVDGVFEEQNNLVFVEFKNGDMKKEKRKVKDKLRDSLLIFCDITGQQIKNTRDWLEFILVYNIDKNPIPNNIEIEQVQESYSRIAIAKHFTSKAKKEFVRFDLEKYTRLYFKNVHTYSKDEFENYLKHN